MSTIPDAPVVAAAPPRPPLRLPLIAALALAFVSLALISGIAYIVVLAGATGTAERLLVDRAARVVDAQVALVKSRLDPVAEHLELIAALAAHGRLDINSPVDMREALWVMMTKVPAISSAGFATFDLRMDRVIRYPDGKVTRDTISLVDVPRGLEQFRELQTAHNTYWGAPFWSHPQQQLVLNVIGPRIMSTAIGIHPLFVFFALLLGSRIAGFWGVFLAMPVAGVINTFVRYVYEVARGRRARTQAATLFEERDAAAAAAAADARDAATEARGAARAAREAKLLTRGK